MGETDGEHVAQVADGDEGRQGSGAGAVAEDVAEEDAGDDDLGGGELGLGNGGEVGDWHVVRKTSWERGCRRAVSM